MARCRSWRPTDTGLQTPQVSAPGVNRKHWAPCRRKVAEGEVRCHECAQRLVEHPDVEVRRMLASEQMLPADVLEVLLVDPDYLVAEYATAATEKDFATAVSGGSNETKEQDW